MKNWKNQITIAIVLLVAIVSCKKDDIPPIPVLTPIGSFSMDFNNFNNSKSIDRININWLYSSSNVTIFSIIASMNVAIPTIAFSESFNHTPTYIGDDTWQWTYGFQANGATLTAKLNGIVQKKQKVNWEMYIDKTGSNSFSNFLWFEGTTTDSTSASWIINQNPTNPSPVLNIEWELNPLNNESTLKYTNVDSGSERVNSYIEYGVKSETLFNRFYTIYLTDYAATISIEWNFDNKSGRVKSPYFYTDESWHCWNKQLQDDWCD